MAVISNKNINTLINNFLKKPNEFESYMGNCLSILKKINYIKENVRNENVDNETFFETLSHSIGITFMNPELYNEYRKTLLDSISNEKFLNVKTNVFYVDFKAEFVDSFVNKNYSEIPHHFSRMICSITTSIDNFDNEKIYQINELFELSYSNKITILDSHVEPDKIILEEIIDGLKSKSLILSKSRLDTIDMDTKIYSDYNACSNDFDRRVWYKLYENYLNYYRYTMLYSDNNLYNPDNDYNITMDHMLEIINKIKSKYTKNKKGIPAVYQKIILKTLNILEKEKEKNNSYNTFFDIKEYEKTRKI